ncbi:heterodisulfide reductase, iron-sulfur binding subunit, putative [Citrifermentans bremense]|uniref:Heterodisulfide reductase, iron-sulfur binding subunit, putative n=1 Tax=Citrifermentans bremense TaxID=60035 RepID=A0A6S6M1W7_9BACT|nr:4Fe-4S dicluster domain-containing protein [Citrifermentans bremense]BCG45275.1 heterodisulfide reductase, iron-sulfur binding subunit, putative [Citrifermentans bremense]
MPQIITEENLRNLIDLLVKESKVVVGPKETGSVVLYQPLTAGSDLRLDSLPRRSAKELFFPICENILTYQRQDGKMQVTDVDRSHFPETVLIGAPPCDAASPAILDAVFSWDYNDEFYLERRRKSTIVGIACTKGDDACFCTAVGLARDTEAGSDLFLTPLKDGSYGCKAVTEKGKALVDAHAALFGEAASVDAALFVEQGTEKLDLAKIKNWLEGHFEDPLWEKIADICVGCGSCAFICPACHCFDINDEGSTEQGSRRKHWDACGFSKFTNHASGHNPRDVQNKRYRNRIMHKFKYYDDKFGKTLCTGCGRCVRACPVGIDIAEILSTINAKQD